MENVSFIKENTPLSNQPHHIFALINDDDQKVREVYNKNN